MKTIYSLMCLWAFLFLSQTEAFVSRAAVVSRSSAPTRQVVLQERRWNFNDGQSPWGMKKNAEIWNGRFSQVSSAALLRRKLSYDERINFYNHFEHDLTWTAVCHSF